jgi:DNA-binding NarL/FixJ family response regulator
MTDPARILIADDHTLVCDGLRKLVEPPFHVVGTVADGRALLRSAVTLAPDVVLVDVGMPLLNGLDAGRQLKMMMPKLKLVYLTMNQDCDLASEALRLGASAYLLKSSQGPELVQAIHEVLRGKTFISRSVARELDARRSCDPRGANRPRCLTERQREVLQLIAEGYSMEQIAMILNISKRTVAFHKYRMMEDFGIGNNADLIRFALNQHLVSAA